MNILLCDVETSPNIATVWGIWQQNVAINQILEAGEVICWAAKWYGSKDMMFNSIHMSEKHDMLNGIHELIDEADAIVTYNGRKFDIPTLNRDFLLHGFLPPSPHKNIDLLDTIKRRFKFVSNKMDFVAEQLGINGKVHHEGHTLWLKCMADDKDTWKKMEEYNRHDVEILEQLYERILPWVRGHANHSTYQDNHVCPNCGGSSLQRRGMALTSAMRYQRYQCNSCGAWSRNRMSEFKAKDLLSPII
jgi:predicted RNA-binding Zn-ribbon protein involved in translation (DUF1610 family)